MPITFFSSKKDNTGAAFFLSFDSKGEAFYAELIKQNGWSNENQNGIFKGGAKTRVKFSLDEVSDMIQTVKNKSKCSFYHKFVKDGVTEVTSGTFSFYSIKGQDDKVREGFGLSVKKGNLQYKVGFSLGAAEKLLQYIQFGLVHVFSSIYATDKKRALEYLEKNKVKETKEEVKGEVQEEGNIEP